MKVLLQNLSFGLKKKIVSLKKSLKTAKLLVFDDFFFDLFFKTLFFNRPLSYPVRRGTYFVSTCCTDVEIEQLPSSGSAVGLDFLNHLLSSPMGWCIPTTNISTSPEERLYHFNYFKHIFLSMFSSTTKLILISRSNISGLKDFT